VVIAAAAAAFAAMVLRPTHVKRFYIIAARNRRQNCRQFLRYRPAAA